MNSPRTFSGKTVDEATEDALATLGVELEDVEITVLSPGRSGILGFGGEPAKIEVRLHGGAGSSALEEISDEEEDDSQLPEASDTDSGDGDSESDDEETQSPPDNREGRPRRPSQRSRGRGTRVRGQSGANRGRGRGRRNAAADEETPAEEAPVASTPAPSYEPSERSEQEEPTRPPRERDAEAEKMVAEILDYFLATMGVVADTYVRDELEEDSLVFEIEGEDAGLLIGRRGETLQSLQFLVRMIVSRQLGRKAYVVIDVEDYRRRRADMLRRLARRTAGRVATSGRSTALDPMSPGERRIVHMSLASHPRVRTESEGEGNQRRVVVLPRR